LQTQRGLERQALVFNQGQTKVTRSLLAQSTATFLLVMLISAAAQAQTADEPGVVGEVTVVEDRIEVLPTTPVESVFGFGKTVLETPRAVTTISNEMMNKVIITEIDDLVALTPGSFTQSFFGVAGSLDVRGTAGETYFRGVKRIDNPGNYPTPIGASDRIDVVRGPASPIYGPSKIGGYLNFVPKSARASTGQYMAEAKGELGINGGSWDKKNIHAEVGGPTALFGKSMGYYLYAEFENSDSYYQNTGTDQSIFQASFDMTISDSLRSEFGGMYQSFKGNQVAGWNRLTQDLVDNGTYITGSPRSFDVDGDGLLSPADITASGAQLAAFLAAPSTLSPADIIPLLSPDMALLNPGTTHIDGSTVLVQEDDTLEDDVVTLYFDLIAELPRGLKITNKSFFESLDNNNENAYGFSQFAETWVFEDQLIFGFSAGSEEKVQANLQFSPSIRHQNFEHGDDFDFEFFDRRDITQIGTPIDRRALATRGQSLYSSHTQGNFTDYGAAVLADITLFEKLNILAGARYDHVEMESEGLADGVANAGVKASDSDGGESWSASVSYELPFGIRPYATIARQSTLITGQGGQIDVGNLINGTAVADSRLNEYGIKAKLLGGKLYTALDYFEQQRLDFSAQDLVTNNTTQATGYEFELRWVVMPQLTLTGAYTNLNIINLTARDAGTQFSFAGAEDVPGVDPSLFFGGVLPSIILLNDTNSAARKGGIPENMYSAYAIFSFDSLINGLTGSIGATHVDSVYSGFSQSVKLPAYTLVNLGVHYEITSWKLGLQVKNVTDERYFRSNFPDLFGSSVVLPELPRSYLVSATYKF
jgi:iron complex outermembrane recepter protein